MPEVITVEYRGRVAIITIDNQQKLNALTQDQYYQIAKFLREIAEHDEVFITVLTAKGILICMNLKTKANSYPRTIFLCVS